ncbi:MAG: FtsW/RodA/SpoVE family cell cycle protein [Lentilactobacillus diolivorans]|uniref:Bacterial cell division membrane protein FtsW n=2 Tax=Lentilactobacillus diolivorans TaxID=179838 RepID=A0A0R1SUR7_9LACO|nr:FtsW/RodA/SpoVE family cell cycle protein [Lentilactobacillus diolivorans]RRG04474.1 MAG: rod shape-determining protein RodA [Lactobacillus sp.]KRL69019.1 bacterial cell division membrane protein FtsW [Lentilactobacillus diolivorans DSM 14421]MCH4165667.1 FtsW/RodA/SpoVE family cell cycle protein [Lentilactobacillus diolivorans]MDH5106616.1 FtsW/RodA/SpoVE family cell cycle protein [Lentilactobacillus diolivorans]GEP22535.1 cell division protein FtsW [Lentilactobacillus diolivorans]
MDTSRKNTKDSDSRIDWGIIFCVLMLALIGLASIYVAASHDSSATSVLKQVVSQLVWYVIGIIAVVIIMQFDSEQLWKVAPIVYWAGILLLASVLVLYSRVYFLNTGAKSWFSLFGLTFQPSEVMKPAYILMMARVIVQHNDDHPIRSAQSDWLLLGKMLLWTIPIAVLLKLQNDFGTMLVFFAILGGMIIVSGITWKIILPSVTIIFGVAGTALALVIPESGRRILEKVGFQAYQFARVDTWLHPASDTSNQGYQLWQSMKAIGSGGIFGTGFNQSHVYVPVRESDMIFSVIGENFGFFGSCILILLYFLLIYQMIKVTFDTRNVFYAYISSGVIMMILFHVFENVGMSIGLLPLTGIPLPFVSAGGSALIGNMIGIGLIMSMQYHNKSYMFGEDKEFS